MATNKVTLIIGAVDKTKGAFASVDKGIKGISAAHLAMATAAVAAVGAVIGKYAQLVDQMADVGDQFDKMSQRTGVSVEALSELAYSAELSGTNVEAVEKGVRKLAVSMYDAQRGSKEYADAFLRLGLSIVDTDGKLRPVEDVLVEMADALAGVTSESEKSALAQRLLGKSGAMLLPMLQQGSQALRDQAGELKALGAVMTGEYATASAEFVDAQARMGKAWDGLKMAMTEPWLEDAAALMERIAFAMGEMRQRASDAGLQDEPTELVSGSPFAELESHYESLGAAIDDFYANIPVLPLTPRLPEPEWLSRGAAEAVPYGAGPAEIVPEDLLIDSSAPRMVLQDEFTDLLSLLPDIEGALDDVGDAGVEAGHNIEQSLTDAFANAAVQMALFDADAEQIFKSIAAMLLQLAIRSAIGFKDGGEIGGFAKGGAIPHAAHGFAVPDGPRGLDSMLIRAMPGEEVINRRLSQRLDRWLAYSEATMAPDGLAGGRGGGSVSVHTGFPVRRADAILMRRGVEAALRDMKGGTL